MAVVGENNEQGERKTCSQESEAGLCRTSVLISDR